MFAAGNLRAGSLLNPLSLESEEPGGPAGDGPLEQFDLAVRCRVVVAHKDLAGPQRAGDGPRREIGGEARW